jgi:hypothetical protein
MKMNMDSHTDYLRINICVYVSVKVDMNFAIFVSVDNFQCVFFVLAKNTLQSLKGMLVVVYHLIHLPLRDRHVAMNNLGNQPPSSYSQKLCMPCFTDKIFDIVMLHYEFYSA